MVLDQEAPLISVICPVTKMHGRLQNFSEWLESSSEFNIEIFLVHDVQDSDTGDELRRILVQSKHPTVHFSEGKFGNAGDARNSVLKRCKGAWICFWDSDDLPIVSEIVRQLDDDYQVVIGEFEIHFENGEIEVYSHKKSRTACLRNVSFSPGIWRFAFRAEVIFNLKFPPFRMGEDQGFLAQIDWQKLNIKFVNRTFYKYFSGYSFQTTARTNSRASLLDSLQFLKSLLDKGLGTPRFIHNLIFRQSLTLMKTSQREIVFQTISLYSSLIKRPKYFFGQINALKDFIRTRIRI